MVIGSHFKFSAYLLFRIVEKSMNLLKTPNRQSFSRILNVKDLSLRESIFSCWMQRWAEFSWLRAYFCVLVHWLRMSWCISSSVMRSCKSRHKSVKDFKLSSRHNVLEKSADIFKHLGTNIAFEYPFSRMMIAFWLLINLGLRIWPEASWFCYEEEVVRVIIGSSTWDRIGAFNLFFDVFNKCFPTC